MFLITLVVQKKSVALQWCNYDPLKRVWYVQSKKESLTELEAHEYTTMGGSDVRSLATLALM